MSAYDIVQCSAKGRSAEQKDAIALDDRVIQAANHLSQQRVESGEVLLAIADGVATSQAAASMTFGSSPPSRKRVAIAGERNGPLAALYV